MSRPHALRSALSSCLCVITCCPAAAIPLSRSSPPHTTRPASQPSFAAARALFPSVLSPRPRTRAFLAAAAARTGLSLRVWVLLPATYSPSSHPDEQAWSLLEEKGASRRPRPRRKQPRRGGRACAAQARLEEGNEGSSEPGEARVQAQRGQGCTRYSPEQRWCRGRKEWFVCLERCKCHLTCRARKAGVAFAPS